MNKFSLEKLLADHVSSVHKSGFSVQLVGGGHEGFAYTIGMAKHGFADVLISCPNHGASMDILHMYFDEVMENGEFTGRKEGIFANSLPMYVNKLEPTEKLLNEYVTRTLDVYKQYPELINGDISFVQILLPDKSGVLPHEDGYCHVSLPQEIHKPLVAH